MCLDADIHKFEAFQVLDQTSSMYILQAQAYSQISSINSLECRSTRQRCRIPTPWYQLSPLTSTLDGNIGLSGLHEVLPTRQDLNSHFIKINPCGTVAQNDKWLTEICLQHASPLVAQLSMNTHGVDYNLGRNDLVLNPMFSTPTSKWTRFEMWDLSFFPAACEWILTISVQLIVTPYVASCLHWVGGCLGILPPTSYVPDRLGCSQTTRRTTLTDGK